MVVLAVTIATVQYRSQKQFDASLTSADSLGKKLTLVPNADNCGFSGPSGQAVAVCGGTCSDPNKSCQLRCGGEDHLGSNGAVDCRCWPNPRPK